MAQMRLFEMPMSTFHLYDPCDFRGGNWVNGECETSGRPTKKYPPKKYRFLQAVAVALLGLLGLFSSLGHLNAQEVARAESVDLIAKEIGSRVAALQLQATASDENAYLNLAVSDFYAQRQYRPIWQEKGALAQLISSLDALEDDGLNPEDYAISRLRTLMPPVGSPQPKTLAEQVDDELLATHAYLHALYHLYKGKVNPASLDPQWNFDLQDVAPTVVSIQLADSIQGGNIGDLFAQARPQHPLYERMRAGLRLYRHYAALGGWPSLPAGPTLKPCMVDPQVAILRRRLAVTGEYMDAAAAVPAAATASSEPRFDCAAGDAASSSPSSQTTSAAGRVTVVQQGENLAARQEDASAASSVASVNPDEVFDARLVAAVKRFQRDQYLEDDGSVGPATRAALNVSVQSRIDQIRVNLERARWVLHNVPANVLLVDVAGYKVTYYKNNTPVWNSRVQVGMSYRTTPIFKSEVNYVTLNPTWTVPPTIFRKDVLPKVRKDPGYLAENNMRVLDPEGHPLDPASIDWNNPGNILLRQDAGPQGALGKAVIRFPNPYSVYLHDTPHQRLFEKSQRAFSSGCIRVERALDLVTLLLQETPGWDAEAIAAALATGQTRNVTLARRVPIFLAYWTLDASPTGVSFKPDIYGRDRQLLIALDKHH